MANTEIKLKIGALARMRGYFFAGLLVVAPVGITFWLSWLVLSFIDARVTPLIPYAYSPNTYVHFAIPGLGAVSYTHLRAHETDSYLV